MRDEVEEFILKEQVAGRLPRKNDRGRHYGVSNFVMDAIRYYVAHKGQSSGSNKKSG